MDQVPHFPVGFLDYVCELLLGILDLGRQFPQICKNTTWSPVLIWCILCLNARERKENGISVPNAKSLY